MEQWLWLLTAGDNISLTTALLLIALSCFTSLFTAMLGIGGGVLLLAVMATTLPVGALIPVHGLVQSGSNANRAYMTRMHIDWAMFCQFSAGACIGALIATLVVVQFPLLIIQLAVAGFILFLVWGPKPKARETSPAGRTMAGMLTTFTSMFVGATGPLVAAFVHRSEYEKMQLTATFASCMTFQHCLKGMVFLFVGFAFTQWVALIILMIASGAVGTWLGLKVLQRVSSTHFRTAFKVVVTLLALRLLWQAANAM